ncbi:MOSC domain-containing protein [Puniceibacterium sediminis]|uniref:MOSC domain-containing protein n=1 Tax=Puniceibacterium sediminis TaxID=1608407 RepID=A0A238UT76_9RHOB|nr:MOSC domain-containing protein [Puniceibacterium sediminis]SNR25355.1 MOSC domain-containing protein [Puniceibacterium sediminis]
MPALKPTEFTATIRWLGRVPVPGENIRSEPVDAIDLGWEGIEGERHSGLTRPSCSRMLSQYPRDTEIRNVRQLSVVSAEELAQIAEKMGLDAIAPEWAGASMVIEGIPDFTHVPPSSRLQGPDGVMLAIDMENRPCVLPAREIEAERAGFGKRFKPSAEGRRGVTAWVERPGRLAVGDELRLHVPDQRVWGHIEAVLS